jgi:small subunit ribosomal protein S4
MSRFLGSIFKRSRRLRFSLLENNKEFNSWKARKTLPGQHGSMMKRMTIWGEQGREIQKMRFMYGLTEKQLRLTFAKAKKIKGDASINLFIVLESRLDNLVYRLGFAKTRRLARQLVNHKHVLVNGKKINIPSYTVKINDLILLDKKVHENEHIKKFFNEQKNTLPFVKVTDKNNFQGVYLRHPIRQELNDEINELLVVRYYSRLT